MTSRYGYGYGEEDPLAFRRDTGVTGQRADEAEQPEHPADVREIDLAEDGQDDEADERVERLRRAASVQDDDEESRAAADAPANGAATVDIGSLSDDGDQAAVLVVDEEDEDAGEPAVAETGDAAGQGGTTLAQVTPSPAPATTGEEVGAAGTPDATAVAPRTGALLAVEAEAVRRQFLDIQAGFVDEPRQAVEQAGELVEELHRKVVESLQAERARLGDAFDAGEPSTEDLRQALRAYRAYVDRLLGLNL